MIWTVLSCFKPILQSELKIFKQADVLKNLLLELEKTSENGESSSMSQNTDIKSPYSFCRGSRAGSIVSLASEKSSMHEKDFMELKENDAGGTGSPGLKEDFYHNIEVLCLLL